MKKVYIELVFKSGETRSIVVPNRDDAPDAVEKFFQSMADAAWAVGEDFNGNAYFVRPSEIVFAQDLTRPEDNP